MDVKNYLVSPIYGNFEGLPRITISTGEFDIMKPDIVKLSMMLDDMKIDHDYIEFKGQSHDFGVQPIKERDLLINDFVKVINDEV